VRGFWNVLAWARIFWKHRVMGTAANHLVNVRDLADASSLLANGIALRSDAPVAGDEPPAGLAAWPPATVVDLRGGGEKESDHPLAGEARIVEIDLMAAADLTQAQTRTTLGSLAELYAMMIAPAAAQGLTQVVAEVARDQAPVLIHCSAGKDRTGVSAALILSLVGVSREDVIADYTATAHHMPAVLARLFSGVPTSIGDTPLSAVPQEVLEAPASAIEAVLDVWAAHPEGVEGWYLANGGDRATLDALRARLLA
jgi:hypothetical protein